MSRGKNTHEYQTVKKSYPELSDAIAKVIEWVSERLLAKGLITDGQKDAAISTFVTAKNRASTVTGLLLSKVEEDTKYFQTLVSVLQQDMVTFGTVLEQMGVYGQPLKQAKGRDGDTVIGSTSATHLSDNDHSWIYEKLAPHAAKWRDIGKGLGFTEGEMDIIQSNPMLLTQSPPQSYLRELLSQWLQWAPGDGRGSTGFATRESLRAALLRANLGQLAEQLHTPSGGDHEGSGDHTSQYSSQAGGKDQSIVKEPVPHPQALSSDQPKLDVPPQVELMDIIGHLNSQSTATSVDTTTIQQQPSPHATVEQKQTRLDELPTLDELLILRYTDEGMQHKLRIITEARHKWKDIASLICEDGNVMIKLEQKCRGDPNECLRQTFIDYFINKKPQGYTQDWNGLIELLDDINLLTLAEKVKHALLSFESGGQHHKMNGGGGSAHGSAGAASAANSTSDNPPTLPTMLKILLPMSQNWENIGIMLSLSDKHLTTIKTRCKGVPDNCLREMLKEWLQQTNPRPTKSALVDAVEACNPSLAQKISAL